MVRLMPNTPCIVREGASVYCRGGAATAEDGAAVKRLFDAVGECLEVPEAMIDAITAVSASGPAYMYLIIEAMADGAVKQGLPRDLAYRLAAQGPVSMEIRNNFLFPFQIQDGPASDYLPVPTPKCEC